MKDWFKKYKKAGFKPIPCRENSKIPLYKDWVNKEFTAEDFASPCNLGIIAPSHFRIVDIDAHGNEDGMRAIYSHLNNILKLKHNIGLQRTASGNMHLLYKAPPIQNGHNITNMLQVKVPKSICGVDDIHIDYFVKPNRFIVAAPSTINGTAYKWYKTPFDIDCILDINGDLQTYSMFQTWRGLDDSPVHVPKDIENLEDTYPDQMIIKAIWKEHYKQPYLIATICGLEERYKASDYRSYKCALCNTNDKKPSLSISIKGQISHWHEGRTLSPIELVVRIYRQDDPGFSVEDAVELLKKEYEILEIDEFLAGDKKDTAHASADLITLQIEEERARAAIKHMRTQITESAKDKREQAIKEHKAKLTMLKQAQKALKKKQKETDKEKESSPEISGIDLSKVILTKILSPNGSILFFAMNYDKYHIKEINYDQLFSIALFQKLCLMRCNLIVRIKAKRQQWQEIVLGWMETAKEIIATPDDDPREVLKGRVHKLIAKEKYSEDFDFATDNLYMNPRTGRKYVHMDFLYAKLGGKHSPQEIASALKDLGCVSKTQRKASDTPQVRMWEIPQDLQDTYNTPLCDSEEIVDLGNL